MILQTLKIDIKIEQCIVTSYKYLIKQINMKTYYSILLSANLSLPYLIITCVSYWYSPRGGILQPTVLHQVLLVNQCGSQIREPQ